MGYMSDFHTGSTYYVTPQRLLKRRQGVLQGNVRSYVQGVKIAFWGFLCVLSETPS